MLQSGAEPGSSALWVAVVHGAVAAAELLAEPRRAVSAIFMSPLSQCLGPVVWFLFYRWRNGENKFKLYSIVCG